MWTVGKEMNMEAIISVMKIRPEKNPGLYRILTDDLCNTGAVHYQLS